MSNEPEIEAAVARPGPTWREVVAAAVRMDSRADALGLLALLDIVKGQRREVPVAELASAIDVSIATARQLVARLEESGWVRRQATLDAAGRPRLVWHTAREIR